MDENERKLREKRIEAQKQITLDRQCRGDGPDAVGCLIVLMGIGFVLVAVIWALQGFPRG